MHLTTSARARTRRRPAIACAFTFAALAGCSGGSETSSDPVATQPPVVAAAAQGPEGVTDFIVVATVTDGQLFLTEDTRVGSLCGGDRGAGSVVETSRVDLFREGDELIEGLAGPGLVDEILLNDDGTIASMTCSFGVSIDLSSADADPYDLVFTSGRTVDAVTLEMPEVAVDALTGALALTT